MAAVWEWWWEKGGPKWPEGPFGGGGIVGELTSIPGFCFFHFVLLFWNHIFTWVSVKLRLNARFNLSQTDKYLVVLNLFSNATNCSYVNAVLALLGLPHPPPPPPPPVVLESLFDDVGPPVVSFFFLLPLPDGDDDDLKSSCKSLMSLLKSFCSWSSSPFWLDVHSSNSFSDWCSSIP